MAAKDWHAEDIKAAIRKSGVTLAQLAIANGYSRPAMSMVLRTPWPAIERIIAKQLKTRPELIWPSRYHSDGSPRSSASSREHKRGRARRHRQIEARKLT